MVSNRRGFMKKSAQCVAAGCLLSQCPGLLKAENKKMTDAEIDAYVTDVSKESTYCGFHCTKDCKWLMGSLMDNIVVMQENANNWSKQNDKPVLPEDQTFCYGCKPVDKPLGYNVKDCSVRQCAIDKEFPSCIECKELETCDQKLWENFPNFHQSMVNKQKNS